MIIKTEDLDTYLNDASNLHGSAEKVYIPEFPGEIAPLLLESCRQGQKLTVSGARTSTTGSAVPSGGSVLSLERLDRIISYDEAGCRIAVEPGLSREALSDFLAERGRFIPPAPTETLSTIGGNAATNASGARTYKFGPIRPWINRATIALAGGDTVELSRNCQRYSLDEHRLITDAGRIIELPMQFLNIPATKHSAGFYLVEGMDLLDLFIGSEGALGVFTCLELCTAPLPENVLGGLFFFKSYPELFGFVEEADKLSQPALNLKSEAVDSFCARLIEFYDGNSLKMIKESTNLVPDSAACAIWTEQEYAGCNEDSVMAAWWKLLLKHSSMPENAIIARSAGEHQKLKDFRHSLPLRVNEIVTANGRRKFGTDTAVPAALSRDLFDYINNIALKYALHHVVFGHIGNSHYHANFFARNEEEERKALAACGEIVKFSIENGGTISAEHGIGKIKREYLQMLFGNAGIEIMKQVKRALDPSAILCPGNIF